MLYRPLATDMAVDFEVVGLVIEHRSGPLGLHQRGKGCRVQSISAITGRGRPSNHRSQAIDTAGPADMSNSSATSVASDVSNN